jgi:hypothetical protein
MAIFKKDLENINSLNDKNRKIHVRSELLQFINLQNESTGYDFSDFKFELDINFRKRFQQHKKIFRDISDKKMKRFGGLTDFVNIFDNGIFNKFLTENIKVFSNLERLVYEIKRENSLFTQDISAISSSVKNSKKIRFDFTHSFLLNAFPNATIDDSVLLNDASSFSTVIKNFEDINAQASTSVFTIRGNNRNTYQPLHDLYKKIVGNPVKFLQTYVGFNFIKTDELNLIKNHNKPLSLMSLATSINNIIENSFDYASCNSLFKGIYTEDELNSKLKFVDFTSVPIIENDIIKEILPIKYVDNFEYINNTELKQLIKDFNSGLDTIPNVKKASQEKISEDIFKFENFLCSESDLPQVSFTSKITNLITEEVNNNVEYSLPSTKLLEIITIPEKNSFISIGKKDTLNYLECLNLIGNHVNSNQLKLVYGVVSKDFNGIPNYDNIKIRSVIDTNKKGILNYKFEDIENFTSSIIKNRLICNNIVKKYKKYSINKGLDASSVNVDNHINYFLDKGVEHRTPIEKDINSLSLNDSIIKINNNNSVTSNFVESFSNQDNVFDIFNKKNNKINKDLIIVNNSILGEMNVDDFIASHDDIANVNNLNSQINDNNIDINLIKTQMAAKKEELKKFTNKYYDNNNPVFKNTANFFQEIKNICSNSIKWHSNKKNKTNFSSDRADLLNNASILWLFNDACKEMTKENREIFQDNFINLLISYVYISSKNLTSFQNAYNMSAENIILNQGPTPSTITELAPFFSFFTNDKQTPISAFSTNSRNPAVLKQARLNKAKNEYYNITPNVFETNGKSTHFLSAMAKVLDDKSNASIVSGHKLAGNYELGEISDSNVFNQNKKNILLTGHNVYRKYARTDQGQVAFEDLYEDKTYCFMPQLIFKKISYPDNKYRFEYFIYNAAMLEFYSDLAFANSFDLVDILNSLFADDLNLAKKYIKQLSYNFQTQNSFLNVLNFGNSYNVELEDKALDNNIFYQIINLFKSLIGNLNLTQVNSFSNFIAQIKSDSNRSIVDLKFMIKNTLKVASSVYCKMFNNLQSYTNLSDRIFESNYFYENSLDNQKLLSGINTSGGNVSIDLNKYSKDMWQYYSNIFLDEPQLYTQFTVNDFLKYRSFASKKFMYFLNEVLGIEKSEIEILMEKILSQNIDAIQIFKTSNNNNINFAENLCTRYKRLIDYSESANINVFNENYNTRLTSLNTDINLVEFMTNPFELFNLYDAGIFQLIPGLRNNSPAANDIDYQINLTPNLTIMNLFKAGNDSLNSYIEFQRNFALALQSTQRNIGNSEKQMSYSEFDNLTAALTNVNLFQITTNVISTAGDPIVDNETASINFVDKNITRKVNSNLIKAAAVFIGQNAQGQNISQTQGIQFDNFSNDYLTYINLVDFENNQFSEGSTRTIANKKNYLISAKMNTSNIFGLIVDNSFNLLTNYENSLVTKNNNNQSSSSSDLIRISGLKESYNYLRGFMNLEKVINIPQLTFNLNTINTSMLNQKYVDINLNWYNHIMHGLITNDIALAFSHDILLYYYDNFVKDFEKNYQKLTNIRNEKISINNLNLDTNQAKSNLSNFGNIDTGLFNLSIDNVKLQKNYIKSLIKTKALKNIVNMAPKNEIENVFSNDINQFMEKIVTLNNQNENGDFFMSYFDDFYIKDLWHILNTTNEANFRNIINKNYQRTADNNNSWNIPNQAENILGSHILTVGINNDYKLDKDDIVLIKVEMTDHDFPEIVWEPKIFEYCAAFEDIENVFLQHRNILKVQSISDITNENPPIGINSSYLEFKLNDRSIFTADVLTLKDSLIQKSDKIVNGLNVSNNIGSLNYISEKSYLNPILYQNKVDDILEILDLANDDFIYSKLPYDFRSKLEVDELKKIREDIIKRCIHNQQINLRLKKISKLLNGFEPNPEFSLTQNKWMQDMFVLSDVYKIFIEDFSGNQDMIKEMYPFTSEEISNAVQLNAYTYAGLNFHKLHFTTNHKLNVYLQFMSDFTKALLPDFVNMTPHNFQKIYTMAVNPKDFIVTGLTGGVNRFVPNSSELNFEQIIYTENDSSVVLNKILDEIGTETSLILRLTSDKTAEIDNVNYYSVINKKNNIRYIPKNVSYRISTIVLE